MKLLLDENLPKRLKQDFPEHEVFTVREMQWNGMKNGELPVKSNPNAQQFVKPAHKCLLQHQLRRKSPATA
jgi:hypothetical protein